MATTVLGLDIGRSRVRAVLLGPPTAADREAGARARLLASVELDRCDAEGEAKPYAAVAAELEAALGPARLRRAKVVVQSSEINALVRYVPTLPMAQDRIERLLRLELDGHAENGELAADINQLQAAGEGEGGEVIHGCVISQPSQVRPVLTALAGAGLRIDGCAAAVGVVGNATLPAAPLRGDELGLLIDIGLGATVVTLVAEDRVLAMRTIPLGGAAFTAELAGEGGDPQSAERRKVSGDGLVNVFARPRAAAVLAAKPDLELDEEAGIPFDPQEQDPQNDELFLLEGSTFEVGATTIDEDPILVLTQDPIIDPLAVRSAAPGLGESVLIEAPIPKPGMATSALGVTVLGPELARVAEQLYAQAVATQRWFGGQLKRERLEIARVLLTGGGAGLVGLDVYLQRRFGVPVACWSPFSHHDGGPAIAGEIPAAPHAWATALGLALSHRALAIRGALAWDLRPERDLIRSARRQRIVPLVAAAVLVLGAGACAAAVLFNEAAARRATAARFTTWKADRDRQLADLAKLDQDREALGEDLRAIAARVYAGRDLLFAIRALKERAGEESKEVWVTKLETVGIQPARESKDGRDLRVAKLAVHDSVIDRGAVLVSGRVKFSSASTDSARDAYRKEYQQRMQSWTPGAGQPTLFASALVEAFAVDHEAEAKLAKATQDGVKEANEGGTFQFTLRLTFQPTRLDQITAVADR